MDIEFHWSPQPSSDDRETIESELTSILQDRDIKPCHHGAISVSLGISGPLDNRLHGSVKCRCGKMLMTFEGDSNASNLAITELENADENKGIIF